MIGINSYAQPDGYSHIKNIFYGEDEVVRVQDFNNKILWAMPCKVSINFGSGVSSVKVSRRYKVEPSSSDVAVTITTSGGTFQAYYGDIIDLTITTKSGYSLDQVYAEDYRGITVVGDMSLTIPTKSSTGGTLSKPVVVNGGKSSGSYAYNIWAQVKNNNSGAVVCTAELWRINTRNNSVTGTFQSMDLVTYSSKTVEANGNHTFTFEDTQGCPHIIAVYFTRSGYKSSLRAFWTNWELFADSEAFTSGELPRAQFYNGIYEDIDEDGDYDVYVNVDLEYSHPLPLKMIFTTSDGQVYEEDHARSFWGYDLPSLNTCITLKIVDPTGWFRVPPDESIYVRDMTSTDDSI